MRRLPTAPLAAAALIIGYAVAVASGSRPLGGFVLVVLALVCVRAWNARHGPRVATRLTAVLFVAFVVSHVLAPAIGAWPAVLLVAAASATIVWLRADSHERAALGLD